MSNSISSQRVEASISIPHKTVASSGISLKKVEGSIRSPRGLKLLAKPNLTTRP